MPLVAKFSLAGIVAPPTRIPPVPRLCMLHDTTWTLVELWSTHTAQGPCWLICERREWQKVQKGHWEQNTIIKKWPTCGVSLLYAYVKRCSFCVRRAISFASISLKIPSCYQKYEQQAYCSNFALPILTISLSRSENRDRIHVTILAAVFRISGPIFSLACNWLICLYKPTHFTRRPSTIAWEIYREV